MEEDKMNEKVLKLYQEAIALKDEKSYSEACDLLASAWAISRKESLHDHIQQIVPLYSSLLFATRRYDEGLAFHHDALQYAIEQSDLDLEARMSMGIGAISIYRKQFDDANEALERTREIGRELDDKKLQINALTNLALIQSSIGNIQKSLMYYRELFNLGEEIDSRQPMLHACLNLQALYFNINDYKRSRRYGEIGLEIAREQNKKDVIIAILTNIANIHQQENEYEESLKINKEIIDLMQQVDVRVDWVANVYLNTGLALNSLKRFDEGEKYLEQAIAAAKKDPETCFESLIQARANLSEVYIHRNQLERAEKLLEELLPSFKTHELELKLPHFMKFYAEVLTRLGKHEKSNRVYRDAMEFTLKHFDQKLTEEIGKAQALIDHDMQVREAKLLRQKNDELEKKNQQLEKALSSLNDAHLTIRDLERKNTINAMAVTTNHELNQPLMIIRGNLELMINSCHVDQKPCDHYIERISEAIERIEKILTKYRDSRRSRYTQYSEHTSMVTFDEDADK